MCSHAEWAEHIAVIPDGLVKGCTRHHDFDHAQPEPLNRGAALNVHYPIMASEKYGEQIK